MRENELFIINNCMNMTQVAMANQLGVSQGTIEYYMRKNNLKKKFSFSDEENEYMKNHYLDMSYQEIANHLGYTEKQIRGRINNMGLTKTRKINDHYFDIIDTSDKAYFLGFIYADGWIVYNENNRNYEFGMQLQSQDKYILEKLNQVLGNLNIIHHNNSNEKIIDGRFTRSNDSDTLRVYSKNLILGLKNNGIEQNKTRISIFPIVSDSLFPDFLRGYIDGDGCYWKSKSGVYMHITSCNDAVLKYVQNKLSSYNIRTRIYKEKENKYRLMCSNLEGMKKLINLLYYSNDLICLSRKYEMVKSYLIGSAA